MREYVTLTQLQLRIKGVFQQAFQAPVWVKAEIHELNVNAGGHCYMELVEKGAGRDVFSAKVRAVLWRSRRPLVEAAFMQGTGRRLEVGMTVLVQVRVQYSELYGMSLSIEDIDPAFTLGEVELARQRTVERLRAEGMLERNAAVPFSRLPRRFALITSETAAGYGDFMHHLYDNGYGFRFYTRLYQAPMQGPSAPAGIIGALNAVLDDMAEGEVYDAVLILRGGGAVADLVCFDDYDLAVAVATFPLRVMVAVGHERDSHVCDMVAAVSVKTPTALADYVVMKFVEEDAFLTSLSDRAATALSGRMDVMHRILDEAARRLQSGMSMRCVRERAGLDVLGQRIAAGARNSIGTGLNSLKILSIRMGSAVSLRFRGESGKLDMLELRVRKGDPVAMLRPGSAYVLRDGSPVDSVQSLAPGDRLELMLRDGKACCTVDAVSRS